MFRFLILIMLSVPISGCMTTMPDKYALAHAYYGDVVTQEKAESIANRYIEIYHPNEPKIQWGSAYKGYYFVNNRSVYYGYLMNGKGYMFVFKNDLLSVVTLNGVREF